MDLLLVWYGTSSFSQILPKSRITARLPYLCLLWGRLYRCCLVLETCSFSRMIYKWMTLTVDVRRVCIMSAFFFLFLFMLVAKQWFKMFYPSMHLVLKVFRVYSSKKLGGTIHVQSFDVSSASVTTFLWSFFFVSGILLDFCFICSHYYRPLKLLVLVLFFCCC